MPALFIDESKSKKFLMCAVQVAFEDLEDTSRKVSSLRLKGQTRIHFVSESKSRRKQILDQYRKLRLKIYFFTSSAQGESWSREQCLRALVNTLDEKFKYRVWIETDSNHLLHDKKVLGSALAFRQLQDSVEYVHTDSKTQPLLWLPDAFAWLKNRGGDWAIHLKGFDIRTIEVS